jgi:hypothetical protein
MASTSAKWECIFYDIILSIFLAVTKKDLWVSIRGGQCQPQTSHIWSANYYCNTFSTKGCWSAWSYKGGGRKRKRRERERKYSVIKVSMNSFYVQYLWITSILSPLQMNHGWNPISASNDFWSTHFFQVGHLMMLLVLQIYSVRVHCSVLQKWSTFVLTHIFFMALHCKSDQFPSVPVQSHARKLSVHFSRVFSIKLFFKPNI